MKKLTQSSCHVVGRTVTGMPDQLSFRMASEEGNDGNTVLNKNVHAKCFMHILTTQSAEAWWS